MTIKELINHDVKEAMRAQDKKLLTILRLITAAIKQIEVDERIGVDDQRLVMILNKMRKQRNESITQFAQAQRDDLVAQEQYELTIINKYLPQSLSTQEIEQLIDQVMNDTGATSNADMGKVMGQLKEKLQGRADMAAVSALIKARLN